MLEVTSTLDEGVRLALRAWDLFDEVLLKTLRDVIPVAEQAEERLSPLGKTLPPAHVLID